jgi:hypothetical protein
MSEWVFIVLLSASMKKALSSFALLCTLFTLSAQEPMEGTWQTGKDNTTIEIINLKGEWLGQIKGSDNSKALTGTPMIKRLKKQGKGYVGQLYVIRYGRWVDAFFEPKDNSLFVTVSSGFRSKTLEWIIEQ